MNTYNLTGFRQQAEQINFTSLLNSYCRELDNWSRYEGIPKYDPGLADYMKTAGHSSFIRFDFADDETEVFAPLRYFSETGIHVFGFPVVQRHVPSDKIEEIGPLEFTDLAAAQAAKDYPDADAALTKERLQNSIRNLAGYLEYTEMNQRSVSDPEQTFIASEQSLIAGHNVHPLPKIRDGFSEKELMRYSPETGGTFPLHYFLVHPDNVIAKNADEAHPSEYLRVQLATKENEDIQSLLKEYSDWKVVPVHPWEAVYLLKLPEVQEMLGEKCLLNLGQAGSLFTPTSSVRTVYNADSEWMYKFSLHVKITNSFRVNYPHELHRGYDAARLLKTEWGKGIREDYPEVELIDDPAFIMVTHKGKVIDGFSTSIRRNPFRGKSAEKNVGLVASLFQDGIGEQEPRIRRLMEKAAEYRKEGAEDVAVLWFNKYLDITIRPLVGMFNTYGFGMEFHQQNMLLELNDELFPEKLYYRDNQGYFFREGKMEELTGILPDFGKDSRSFIAEPRMINFWGYYLLVNHLFGLINAFGKSNLVSERRLIDLLYEALKAAEGTDETGLVSHMLNSVKLVVKGNLLTSLNNMDEASAPRTNPAVYTVFPNPLNKYFFSDQLICPQGKDIVFSRYFEKEDVTITLRPVDLDRDLEMLHEWFHREHTLNIWQMNWPIRELEKYYRTLLRGDMLYSYIGEANGVPTFNIEVYWASRDIVGDYYEVLPADYGTHQLIAPTDPKQKYASPATQSMMDFVFAEPKVGKMVGEGAVNSLASMMNKAHVGFKIEKVIEMPHKKANLNFCYREWYWAKFPAARDFKNIPVSEPQM